MHAPLPPLCGALSQLQQYARKRDEQEVDRFCRKIRYYGYKAHHFLWVDETSKDQRSLRRTFGYGLRGSPPIGNSGLGSRGERVSALCSFDVNGFVAWEYTANTYTRERFLSDAQRVIVSGSGPPRSRSEPLLRPSTLVPSNEHSSIR